MSDSAEKVYEKFRSYLEGERKSRNTVRQYSYLAREFIYFADKPLKEITSEDVDRYKHYLATEKEYSKASQHLAINAIKLLLKSNNIRPPLNLTPPRRSRKMPVYLSQREASALLDASREDPRRHAIVSTLIYTGMRVGELCALDLDDIDLDEGVIGIKSGKGDKGRIVIMSEECRDTLKGYLPFRLKLDPPTKALFVSNKRTRYDTSSIERIVRNLSKQAEINKKVTPHVLRHTFATTVMRNGGDIRFIQELLGHSSIATTQIYTHIDENTLREMYSKYRPKF